MHTDVADAVPAPAVVYMGDCERGVDVLTFGREGFTEREREREREREKTLCCDIWEEEEAPLSLPTFLTRTHVKGGNRLCFSTLFPPSFPLSPSRVRPSLQF